MTKSKDSDIREDPEFLEIKELVKQSKEFENNRDFARAKHLVLDAASKCIELSKQKTGYETLVYENIARSLVKHAKELKILHEMETNPLPHIPGVQEEVHLPPTQISKPQILLFMIIKSIGVPIFMWTNEELTEQAQIKLNEILFSGALTAVNQLMEEVLNKPIQCIKYSDGNIVLKTVEKYIYVIFSRATEDDLEAPLNRFCETFKNELLPKLQSDLAKGVILNDNPEILSLLNSEFKTD